jgi:cytochrome c551/c552
MKSRRIVWGVSLVLVACSSARDTQEEPPPAFTATGNQPELGPLVRQKDPPPPISGGTLAAARTGSVVVASDPDRDRIYVVDVAMRAVRHAVAVPPKSEPGRVALDGAGRAHVALRNSGDLATVDLATGALTIRRACAAPRGVAFDPSNDTVWVACATGEVVTFAAGGGEVRERIEVVRDLRDVVITKRGVQISQFRSARLLKVGQDHRPDPSGDVGLKGANLAWRAVAAPEVPEEGADAGAGPGPGEAEAVVTQEPTENVVQPGPGGYGGGGGSTPCGSVGIVSTRLWWLAPGGGPSGSVRMPNAVLPVDVATNGREIVVVAAGNGHSPKLPQLFLVHREQIPSSEPKDAPFGGDCTAMIEGNVPGQAIAAAFDGEDELVVQTREPAALHVMTADRRRAWKTIPLAGDSKEDTGHAVFHSNAGGNIACASCHAEGADDGHTWAFAGMGPRRTPSLLGTTPHTEPFHWAGDMKDLKTLVDHVFVERMSGPKLEGGQVDALGDFMFGLPPPAKLHADGASAERGKTLFQQRCVSCHEGPLYTNNKTVDVGTGGQFQVPSLVGVGWRAPYLHTGCAKTLFDRFDPACGGDKHGDTRDLGRAQIADLVSYLETL